MAVRLVHLSDLHLGNDLIIRALQARRTWRAAPSEDVTRGLQNAIREAQPAYVVISGDFVNKAKRATFKQAADYVRKLLVEAGIDLSSQLLLVPGNHDVSVVPTKHESNAVRLRLYREFLQDLFRLDDIEDRKQRFIRVDLQRRLVLVGLDTTLKTMRPLAEGEVGQQQRDWLDRKLRELKTADERVYDSLAKILVIHHHSSPIAGMPAASERMMSLLDAADLLKVVQEHRVNVILHGHKHVPRVDVTLNSDSTPLIVIGAGTATCPYPEEQHTFGNNFNIVDLDPSRNTVSVSRKKANANGVFENDGPVTRFPLFRANLHGYRIRLLRKVVAIAANGSIHVIFDRQGLYLDPGGRMASLPVRVNTETRDAKIRDMRPVRKPRSATLNLPYKEARLYDGEWQFSPALDDSEEIDLAYEYDIDGSMVMSKADFRRRFPESEPNDLVESTGITVIGGIDRLEIIVRFPQGYAAKNIAARVTHLGVSSPLKTVNLNPDIALNEWRLGLDNPGIDHSITLQWDLPEEWRA